MQGPWTAVDESLPAQARPAVLRGRAARRVGRRSRDARLRLLSGDELFRATEAGGDARRIVFSGVGKRADEMAAALDAGILQFNCESEEELEQLSRVAVRKKTTAPVALRVNPEVDARTHPYIATALASSKFGVPAARVRKAYRLAASLPGLEIVGVACHIGSQIGEV